MKVTNVITNITEYTNISLQSLSKLELSHHILFGIFILFVIVVLIVILFSVTKGR